MAKKIYISITLTDDKEVRELNKKFRNKDKTTDVLSFNVDQELEDGTQYLGDVVISTEQAKRQAPQDQNGYEREISELAGHGILHLLGVHHEHDDEETK
jgi:probable rRNA maturation factor